MDDQVVELGDQYSPDDEFKARARLHQSKCRAGPLRPGARLYRVGIEQHSGPFWQVSRAEAHVRWRVGEVAHRLHRNHCVAFWWKLDETMPEWVEANAMLER